MDINLKPRKGIFIILLLFYSCGGNNSNYSNEYKPNFNKVESTEINLAKQDTIFKIELINIKTDTIIENIELQDIKTKKKQHQRITKTQKILICKCYTKRNDSEYFMGNCSLYNVGNILKIKIEK
jgi:hypothetical protein